MWHKLYNKNVQRIVPDTVSTLVVWLGFLAFVSVMVYFGTKKIPLGPQAKIGWPNRFMVFTYIAWLMLIALESATGTLTVTR